MKKFLENLIKAKEARKAEIESKRNALLTENETVDNLERAKAINKELRELGATLEAVLEELNAAKEQLASLEDNTNDDGDDQRAFNPLGQYQLRTATPEVQDKLSSKEYRSAFKDYVQRGIRNDSVLNVRADVENVSGDLGVLLPNTIVQEVIKGIEKVYGQLYTRVKHTSVKGGIEYPIGAFSANLVWGGTSGTDKEHGVSEKQKAGAITGSVTFSYHIGEIRIAQSLLQTVVSLEAFEKEIVNALIEAYVKAMDVAILDGTGSAQPVGVFTEAAKGSTGRIPTANIIEFTAAEMADWTSWKKKLFAKLPLAMRSAKLEFVMTPNTYEANIETLVDKNGNPVARELTNPVSGDTVCKFYGKEVVLVEEGTSIKNFDDATNGQYFGIVWVPEKAYAINTNLQFGYKRYFDENTNQYITKALVIVDGKPLDTNYIYLLKKKVTSAGA